MPINAVWTDPNALDLLTNQQLSQAIYEALISDLNALGGADGLSGIANRSPNLLVNGGLEIWQRGNGPFTASGVMSADRWQTSITAPSTFSVVRGTTGAQLDVASANSLVGTHTFSAGGAAAVVQYLEDYTQLRTRTITASVRVFSGANGAYISLSDSGGTSSSRASANNVWETLTVTRTVNQGATYLNLVVTWPPGVTSTMYVDNAMLVVSPVPVGYQPLPPADELARARRYYQVLPINTRVTVAGANNTFDFPLSFPVQMAVAPIATMTGGPAANCSVTPINITTAGCGMQLIATAAGDAYLLNGTLTLEANP